MAIARDGDLARRRAVAEQACRAAAEVHLRYRQPAIRYETKRDDRDLVTIADTEAQVAAQAVIEAAFPGEAIIGEEDAPGAEHIADVLADRGWVVDPLDGTFNYVYGFPDFSATVAFVEQGRPLAGATYAPVFGEMFSAARGHGVMLNGAPVSVSGRKGLSQSIVSVWLARRAGDVTSDAAGAATMARIQERVLWQRVFGGTAILLAYLASGRFDLFYVSETPSLHPWDVAAGAVMIEEAGGVVSLAGGDPFLLPSTSMAAAADPGTLQELRVLIAGEGEA